MKVKEIAFPPKQYSTNETFLSEFEEILSDYCYFIYSCKKVKKLKKHNKNNEHNECY